MKMRIVPLMLCVLALSMALGCDSEPTPQPDVTPQPLPTAQVAATPELPVAPSPGDPSEPSLTPAPTETALPGWEKFEGGGVELWLPESYEGGDLGQNLDAAMEQLRSLGPAYEQTAQLIEQNPTMYVIWAFDAELGGTGFLTNVNVTTEQVPADITVDDYLDAAMGQLPAEFQVVERETLSIGDLPAGRLTIEFSMSGVNGKEVVYVVKDGITLWAITYATGLDEFDARWPGFQQSAQTFAVQP
jgi:hypothetical protein